MDKLTTASIKVLPFEIFTKAKLKDISLNVLFIKEFRLKTGKLSSILKCQIFILPPVCQIPSTLVDKQTVTMDIKIMLVYPF